MIAIGTFVRTTRSPELCYVLRANWDKNELYLRRLRDGEKFLLPSDHVLAEENPSDRFREHVREVVKAAASGSASRKKYSNFSEYFSEFLRLASVNGTTYEVDAAINFLVLAVLEQDSGNYKRSVEVVYLDVCWFCTQLGIDAPTRSLVKARIASNKVDGFMEPEIGVGEDEV
ncbi:hypothetical protein [Pseudomonas sp. YL2]|uniref:hypothetical protein n=1 Tax=Pseudomonas sp. YL2 TaxID=2904251 RepID=UPI001FF1120A|nr:hypothetical protein [Pseudomonas sp. YL2]